MHKAFSKELICKIDNDNKCTNLSVHDEELLKRYSALWDKFGNLLKMVS